MRPRIGESLGQRCGSGEGLQRCGYVAGAAVDEYDDLSFEQGIRQFGRIEVIVLGFREVEAVADEDQRRGDRFRLRAARPEDGVMAQHQRLLASVYH